MNKKEEFGLDNFYDLIPGMSLPPSPLPQLLFGTELAFQGVLIGKPTFRDETISGVLSDRTKLDGHCIAKKFHPLFRSEKET